MSLVPDYSGSSDSDTDNDSGNASKQDLPKKHALSSTRLPSASSLFGTQTKPGVGVFKNPYLEAECTKQAALEQHVKMIKPDEYIVEKNGKKICWNSRKGRCRYGNKCQYAHDSDLVQETPTRKPIAEAATSEAAGTRNLLGKRKQASAAQTSSASSKRTAADNS